jgi:hypothetical protein
VSDSSDEAPSGLTTIAGKSGDRRPPPDSAATQLTAFERAPLILRADLTAEERLPPDVLRILKPGDPDVKRIADAVFDANDAFYQGGSYIAEWLYQEEIQLGWLRCVEAMLERDATLRDALRAAGWSVGDGPGASIERKARTVTLRALPEPGTGSSGPCPSSGARGPTRRKTNRTQETWSASETISRSRRAARLNYAGGTCFPLRKRARVRRAAPTFLRLSTVGS